MSIEKIREMIDIYKEEKKLPCPVAHYIAAYLKIDPLEVGKAATELGVMLYQCQIGLFGYGRKGKSGYKIIGRKVEVPEEINQQILAITEEKGSISCKELWQIAEKNGINRAEAGNAADALNIKITPCQLGAF
ncbi:MAG: hypothetical protein JW920_07535 [Deltaproteobacteria bacterium]|nr:hypothetical protein [Deltaproteobacteria bacterium]